MGQCPMVGCEHEPVHPIKPALVTFPLPFSKLVILLEPRQVHRAGHNACAHGARPPVARLLPVVSVDLTLWGQDPKASRQGRHRQC